MSTKAKICTGYTDHMDEWIFQQCYYQHYDGYPENMIPLLKENKFKLDEIFEKLDDFFPLRGEEFIYYIDNSDHGKIRCTVLGLDWQWYKKYGVDHYIVLDELIL